jgi:hypothetical protein
MGFRSVIKGCHVEIVVKDLPQGNSATISFHSLDVDAVTTPLTPNTPLTTLVAPSPASGSNTDGRLRDPGRIRVHRRSGRLVSVYGRTVALQVMLTAERPFAATMWTHILLYSLRVVRVQVGFKVERARKC